MKLVEKSRCFSKRMVIVNCTLAWAAVFMSIAYSQAAYVAATAMGLILTISASYMGIGHMDLRQVVKAMLAGQSVEPPVDGSEPPQMVDPASNSDGAVR